MTMTGARLKEVLEDVADNLFNPDPYYQQGGDMVRVGGVGYTIDIDKPIGSRISDLQVLRTGQAARADEGLRRRRMGERERGDRRPADLGRRHQPHPEAARRRSEGARASGVGSCRERIDAPVDVRRQKNGRMIFPTRRATPPQVPARTVLAAGGATALAGPALAASAGAGKTGNQPPNVPDWTRYLGEGVAVRQVRQAVGTKRM